MNRNALLGLVLALLLIPGMASAATEVIPQVNWVESVRPLAVGGVAGDQVKVQGKVCVSSTSPATFLGKLHYSVWGVGATQCAAACGTCYDREACGGAYCGNICIKDNAKCGVMPGCIGTAACGVDCSTRMDTQWSSELLVNPGQCSELVTFTTNINTDWAKGWYVANLDVLYQDVRNLDLESFHFNVGELPVIDVILYGSIVVGVGLAIVGLYKFLV